MNTKNATGHAAVEMSRDIPVVSINVRGKSERLVADHQSTTTAFRKQPISGSRILLTATGFEGDSVVHTEHHGGNDKAICCYSAEHFAYWKEKLDLDLEPSAFGENLTLSGRASLETSICIGDRYQLGQAIVEVSEPRGPCYIIGIRYNYKQFPVHLQDTGYTGFYLRTLQPGTVHPGDALVHLSSHPEKITVQDVNRTRYQERDNAEWLDRLIHLDVLTGEWRDKFAMLKRNLL